MINEIFCRLQRPEKGWDPIPTDYAQYYANREYAGIDRRLLSDVIAFSGGLKGKRVLDLGAGPGQFAIEFASEGAQVFWHDVSVNYREICRQKCRERDMDIHFSLGYMEEASGTYDLVFNRVCWYYCLDDANFARKVVSLVRPGGCGYILVNTDRYLASACREMITLRRLKTRLLFGLNDRLSLKIGHVMPSHAKLTRLFRGMGLADLAIDHWEDLTRIQFRRL